MSIAFAVDLAMRRAARTALDEAEIGDSPPADRRDAGAARDTPGERAHNWHLGGDRRGEMPVRGGRGSVR